MTRICLAGSICPLQQALAKHSNSLQQVSCWCCPFNETVPKALARSLSSTAILPNLTQISMNFLESAIAKFVIGTMVIALVGSHCLRELRLGNLPASIYSNLFDALQTAPRLEKLTLNTGTMKCPRLSDSHAQDAARMLQYNASLREFHVDVDPNILSLHSFATALEHNTTLVVLDLGPTTTRWLQRPN
jgi:hypothetical protein